MKSHIGFTAKVVANGISKWPKDQDRVAQINCHNSEDDRRNGDALARPTSCVRIIMYSLSEKLTRFKSNIIWWLTNLQRKE